MSQAKIHAASRSKRLRRRPLRGLWISSPRPSLATGAAGLFDFAGVFAPRAYLSSQIASKTALEALEEDWQAVGQDIWRVLPAPSKLLEEKPAESSDV